MCAKSKATHITIAMHIAHVCATARAMDCFSRVDRMPRRPAAPALRKRGGVSGSPSARIYQSW